MVSPNFSIKLLEEEIQNIKKGSNDFTKSVDWRISAPLGILYIASSLKKHGFDVEIFDLHRAFYEWREKGYFKRKTLDDFFIECFEKTVIEKNIDILGISCLFNVASTTVEEMSHRCKQVRPETKIILGGHYPTIKYRGILEKKICDYVILGEAEEEIVWLVRNIYKKNIGKLVGLNPHIVDCFCKDNMGKKPAMIEDLDSLAMPAWELLPFVNDYIENTLHADRIGSSLKKNIRSMCIISTRGCPMHCTFCAAHGVHGRKIRSHSIDYILNHINWIVKNFNINHLLIEDDMFNYNSKRTIDFCKRIHKCCPKGFTIEFPNGLAVWNLTDETVKNLKRSGLKNVTIAVESGNSFVQKYILKKNLDLDKIREKVQLLKKYRINIRVFYVIGLVGETIEMMNDTIDYARELDVNWSIIKVFTPLVGSEMYDLADKQGYIIGDTSEHIYGRGGIKTPDFKPYEVEEIRYDANIRINFLENYSLRHGEFYEAEKIFSKLLDVYPNHLFAQWGLWHAFEGQRKSKESNHALEKLTLMIKENTRNLRLSEKYGLECQMEVAA